MLTQVNYVGRTQIAAQRSCHNEIIRITTSLAVNNVYISKDKAQITNSYNLFILSSRLPAFTIWAESPQCQC